MNDATSATMQAYERRAGISFLVLVIWALAFGAVIPTSVGDGCPDMLMGGALLMLVVVPLFLLAAGGSVVWVIGSLLHLKRTRQAQPVAIALSMLVVWVVVAGALTYRFLHPPQVPCSDAAPAAPATGP